MRIDLNADVGESYGAWRMGQDEALMPLISSANVACGAHAGDPLVIEQTIELARRAGVTVGAHPGYPDRDGFGRRDLAMATDELEASLVYQISAVDGFARAAGITLRHVKAHGALYNRAARDPAVARSVASAVGRCSAELVLVGLAGSSLLDAGRSAGLAIAAEAFADRVYEADGSLRSRRAPGAIVPDAAGAADQALSIVRERRVRAWDGSWVAVEAHTLCIHGDTPGAAAYAAAVRHALEEAGIEVRPLDTPR